MDHAFHLAAVSRIFAQGIDVAGAVDAGDIPLFIFCHALGADHVSVAQTHLFAQHQTFVLLIGFFAEVSAIDPDFTAKGHFAGAHLRLVRMIRHGDDFVMAGRQVLNHHFQRIEHRHGARRVFVQIVANAGFQRRHLDHVILFGNADTAAELADRGGGVAATAQARYGQHARIVPAFHHVFADQLRQLALRHHRIFEVKTRKLILARMHRYRDVIQHPVIEATVILELQRTERMGDVFQRIGDAVGKVVHRIDAPLFAGLVMLGELNAVEHRIAHHDKAGRHIDFGAQAGFTLGEFAVAHFFEQRQVLFDAAVAIGAVFARRGQGAAIFADLFRRQLVDIGQTFIDQFNRVVIKLIEVI